MKLSRSARRARGFTLMELMVVIAILGLLITIVAKNYDKIFGGAQSAACKAQIKNLAESVFQYKLENSGKLPESLEVLAMEDPKSGEKFLEEIPNDPWGNPYEYKLEGNKKFEIRSWGPDGIPGGDDDISSNASSKDSGGGN